MIKVAMISSTSIELPEHRKVVMEACQRVDIFPKAMELFRSSIRSVDQAISNFWPMAFDILSMGS